MLVSMTVERRSPAKSPVEGKAARGLELAPLVKAFASDSDVTFGGTGFGSSALKVRGKIFAMLTTTGQFVVKLPAERVAALVRLGKGSPLETGGGRLMKEWVVIEGGASRTRLTLAREARDFVGG